MPGRRTYDLLYRTGAARWRRGWEVGVGPELRSLVESGEFTPGALHGDRAIDLGCGIGTNAIYLAQHGFDTVGADFSLAAVDQARRTAATANVDVTFLVADITKPIPEVEPPFDALVLYNVVQDLDRDGRRGLAAEAARLSRPGTLALLWCWWATKQELPLLSYRGPSRVAPFVVEPGEEQELFGNAFHIEPLETASGRRRAAFLLTRREPGDGAG
jgi:SAM-dependent methyltransferase